MQGRPCKGGFFVFIFSLMRINLANPSLSQQTSLPFSLTFWLAPAIAQTSRDFLRANRFKEADNTVSRFYLVATDCLHLNKQTSAKHSFFILRLPRWLP